MASSNDVEFWQLNGHALFDILEIEIKHRIPSSLRKILLLQDIDSVAVLAHLNDVYKSELENFIKNDLISEMLNTGETMKDYLGVYDKCQTQFQFSAEQHALIDMMVKCSKRLWPVRKDYRDSVGRTEGNESSRDATRNDQQQPVFPKGQHIGERHEFQHIRDDESTFRVRRSVYNEMPNFRVKCPVNRCPDSFRSSSTKKESTPVGQSPLKRRHDDEQAEGEDAQDNDENEDED